MSFLVPLYLLAASAISLPILFHLIRRTPRGRMAFSSLMFLAPSPPRITRRSRLDQLLLLLLRAAALILLALAFARPFLREAAYLPLDGGRERRVAILVDTSGSMNRDNLWTQAVQEVDRVLRELEAGDDVALLTFGDRVQVLIDFDKDQQSTIEAKSGLVRQQLSEMGATWSGTNLGQALLAGADLLAIANDLQQSDAALQLVLVSDLQQGSRIDALQAYEWPADVALKIRELRPPTRGNATLRIVADPEEGEDEESLRVRVVNSADSASEQFQLRWVDAQERPDDDADRIAVYVPAGQSRIIRVPRPKPGQNVQKLELSGDGQEFDNRYFRVPAFRESVAIGYVGDDAADDPEGLRYYLELALADSFRREVTFVELPSDVPWQLPQDDPPALVVVTRRVGQAALRGLDDYLAQGGCLLVVLHEVDTARQLVTWLDEGEVIEPPQEDPGESDYVMLGEIDFAHPLFAVFADPQYSDFTKIHFWRHTPLDMPAAPGRRVLARFDDGSPAVWQERRGQGSLFVLAAGWRPADSELARSSKFVPLLEGFLESAQGRRDVSLEFTVHDAVELPPRDTELTVHRPDGSATHLSSDVSVFRETDEPGIYRFVWDEAQQSLAVNLAAAESDTLRLDTDRLEQLGVHLGTQPTRTEELARRRQERDMQLENRQKVWQWMIVGVLGFLCLETWLAGRRVVAS